MKMGSVQPKADIPTETMTDLEKLDRVCSNLSVDNCLFLVPTCVYSLSFCRLMGGATVKSFSSVNQIKLTADAGYFFSSYLARTRRGRLVAAVSSFSRSFLKQTSCRSLWIMRWTDDLSMPVSCTICLTVL